MPWVVLMTILGLFQLINTAIDDKSPYARDRFHRVPTLTRRQMSLQARMLSLADVFEALASANRPYRPRMKLSKALEIMVRFSKNGRIDSDLFDVFVHQGVYRHFAEKYMNPEQIDLPPTGTDAEDTMSDQVGPQLS